MTDAELGPFLLIGSIICGLMAIVSAFRYKSRGISAYIMAAGFVVLGSNMLLLRTHQTGAAIAGIVLLVLLLGADFAARSAHKAKKDAHR